MRRRAPATLLLALAAAATVTLIGAKEARADARTEARAHFRRGMKAIANGRYEDGIPELERAYETLPHPNVLYNIARAYAESGDLEHAIATYRRYLDGDPEDRAQIELVILNLESRLSRQRSTLQEARTPAPPVGAASGAPAPLADVKPAAPPAAPPSVAPKTEGGLGAARTEDVFEETVVTASRGRESPLDAEASTSILTEQDIRLSGITKIPELLRRFAGVEVMETTGAQTEVSIRGFNQRLSNKVLVLVDGRSVYVDLLGATFWQSLSIGVEDIERIEIVRGPGSALYGADAFGGIINIITKKPGDGPSGVSGGVGDHGATHGSVWSSGKRGDFSFRASAGYDSLPRWSREVPPGRVDLHLSTSDQESSSRTARLDLRTTERVTKDVTLGLGGGLTEGSLETLGIGPLNDVPISDFQASDVTAKIESPHFEARVFWNHFRPVFGINAAPIGQSLLPGRAETHVVDGEAQFVTKNRLRGGAGGDAEKSGPTNDLHVGLGYRLKEFHWTYLDEPRMENHESIFVHDAFAFSPVVSLVIDGRLDYVPYLARLVPSPKAALLVHPSKASTIRASVGTAFRAPTFLESYLSIPIQLPAAGASLASQGVRGDQPGFKLAPENIASAELGYTNQESDVFAVDVNVFYDRASNLIAVAENRAVTVADAGNGLATFDAATGTYPIFFGGFDNQCQVYGAAGAELGGRLFPAEGLDFYANYTYEGVSEDLSGCPAATKALLAGDARTSAHKINAGAEVRTKLGVDGSVDFHYVSPETWAEQVSDVSTQRLETQAFHLDAYTLLNARAGVRLLKNQLEVSGVAWNLLGTIHREHPFGQEVGRRVMGLVTYRF